MLKTKHWLHVLLSILTCGLWVPMYVIVIASTEMHNRGYRLGKAAGRVEKSNEYEAERMQPKTIWQSPPDQRTYNCRCVVEPINVDAPVPSSFLRFKELGDRMLSGDRLDSYEQYEYNKLRAKVIR